MLCQFLPLLFEPLRIAAKRLLPLHPGHRQDARVGWKGRGLQISFPPREQSSQFRRVISALGSVCNITMNLAKVNTKFADSEISINFM